ncbi:MAG: twin-arginine translocase subunit TatC [Firmicutes bacterium]|nr:twin-arginine translocase subunit TatC [Bacillota bacterium]
MARTLWTGVASGKREAGALGESERFSLVEHLEELRRRLIVITAVLAATGGAAYYFTPSILARLMAGQKAIEELVFLSPAEAFFTRMKLAFAVGFVASLPVMLWQIWAFVAPALDRRTKVFSFLLIPVSSLLFAAGAFFAYVGVLPFALRFFLGFSSAELQPLITVGNFVSFATFLILPFGIVFELPVVVFFLSRLGLVGPRFLSRNRKFAILGIFTMAALLTPGPDVFSQMMMAVPMVILYEISILIARLVSPR